MLQQNFSQIKFMDLRNAMTVGAIHGRVRTYVLCRCEFFIAITPIIRRHRQHIVVVFTAVIVFVVAVVDCTVKWLCVFVAEILIANWKWFHGTVIANNIHKETGWQAGRDDTTQFNGYWLLNRLIYAIEIGSTFSKNKANKRTMCPFTYTLHNSSRIRLYGLSLLLHS